MLVIANANSGESMDLYLGGGGGEGKGREEMKFTTFVSVVDWIVTAEGPDCLSVFQLSSWMHN